MARIAVVYFSAQGHTKELAEGVAEGVKSVSGSTIDLLRLVGEDIVNGRWKNPAIIDSCNAADAIIFGTPTYMGGYSAQMKAFIDSTAEIWMKQGWKDKLAAGFTHSLGLSGDKLNTLQGLMVNAMQHGMLWISLGHPVESTAAISVNRLSSWGGAMAQTDWGQEKVNEGDLKTAKLLGARVAQAAARWVKGA